ncbi:hypothetical protein HRI_004088000 [Hibiscus trionum]|uniref:Reverse transcriptase domain-containing protein n=1 Tax=Hibiscus trionum TaxID=183268 RepID=A0A9W7IZL6_HIBTR|nr:hypothetical protein HRI_004088000 [Hibiscus trionum]
MKTLSWNVRGLGKLWAVQRLRNKLRDVRPDIVFLLETKLSSSRMVEARRRCGFPCGFDVSSVGSCGGLSLAWRSNIPVSIISWSIFHIDAMVKENETSCEWRLTGFYGNPVERLREESWDLLRNLSVDQSHPWLVIGDFNEILLSSEKRGGRIRSARSMEAFRRALGDCDLEDLGFSVNMQDDGNALGADRAFKFSAEWTMEEDCESLIKQFWEETNLPLSQKLVELGVKLSAWSRGRKGDCRKRTRELNDKLKALTDRDPDDDTLAEILDVKLALNVEADKDELYWEQRARVNWLRHGDRNSSFFHKWASVRKKKNTISKLQNDDGVWFSEDTEMLNLVGSYFQKLFTSSDMVDDRRLLDCVRPVITGEVNSKLTSPFNREEIDTALRSMAPLKASGFDGYPALFYQRYWSIVGDKVSDFCLQILNNNGDLDAINSANIVLLPKVTCPTSMVHFRPISLCNVLYKIIAKAIVHRIAPLLGMCIDDTQGVFVAGRHITDNILIAYEVLHTLKMRKGGKRGSFALKLDMSKAYDRVEWRFVEDMMVKLGFDINWVSLVMRCVSTVSYQVILNDNISPSFRPTRGLRQGDPLSPYLFLFCAQGLSALLNEAKSNKQVAGVKVGRQGVTLTHLFFADDCILFGEASTMGAQITQNLMLAYERASGQKVNFEKSLIYFSSNVSPEMKDVVGGLLGVRIADNAERYLGLPTMIGRNKREAFANLKDKTNTRVDCWSNRFLSMGGKEVFIKSVLQAIPIYAMQCFLFPLTLCTDLEAILNKFWWCNSGSKKGIHWSRWIDLCGSKEMGGMGFRNLAKFNIAILAKQGWSLLTNPDSLLSKVFRGHYYPNESFLHANLGSSPSYAWKSIWASRGLLEKGIGWIIGDGKSVNIWNDSWVPGLSDGRITVDSISTQFTTVFDLIKEQGLWKEDVIRRLFNTTQAAQILKIPLANVPTPDVYTWRHDNSAKVKVTCWRFVKNYIPTNVNLSVRRIPVSINCLLCDSGQESVQHLFECRYFKHVLRILHCNFTNISGEQQWLQWLANLFESLSVDKARRFLVAIWAIWGYRNKRLHENANQRPEDIANYVIQYIREVDEASIIKNSMPKQRKTQWDPPPTEYVKTNFDASYQADTRITIIGIIIRNEIALIMGAGAYPNLKALNPEMAKALACRQALRLTQELGFRRAVVEGDSLQIINKLRNFEDLAFKHTPRDFNLPAHLLAKEGRFCVTPRIWVEEAPMAVEAAADEDRRRLRLPS